MNEVKGFSKEYFMYFEDVDLSYKLKKAGKKNTLLSASQHDSFTWTGKYKEDK